LRKERRANLCLKNKKRRFSRKGIPEKREKNYLKLQERK